MIVNRRQLPIGIQPFRRIRKQDCYAAGKLIDCPLSTSTGNEGMQNRLWVVVLLAVSIQATADGEQIYRRICDDGKLMLGCNQEERVGIIKWEEQIFMAVCYREGLGWVWAWGGLVADISADNGMPESFVDTLREAGPNWYQIELTNSTAKYWQASENETEAGLEAVFDCEPFGNG